MATGWGTSAGPASRPVPEVRYATSGRASIAYQAFGRDHPAIVAVPPLAQNIELIWEWPSARRLLEGFGSFCRYVHFDKRGTGMSSLDVGLPGLDQRIDDTGAVMDAAGVERAWVYGVSEGGPMALLFAASYPDRVHGVILESTAACLSARPTTATREVTSPDWAPFLAGWGTSRSITPQVFAPSLADDPAFHRFHQRYERQSASPSTLGTLMRMNAYLDARDALASIVVPVLLIHRTGDPVVAVELAREAAAALPNARLVEMPGADHFTYASEIDTVLDEVARFVTGRPASERRRGPRAIAVRTLGDFAVTVDGAQVPTSAWGSRRARQLLKRLVAARGRPVTRDALIDQLWPGHDDLARLGARLSVQLSTVRRVLGGRITSDNDCVALDLDEVDVDVESLLGASGQEVLDRYGGEFLPEDVGQEWADGLRQAVRSHVVRAGHEVLDAAGEDPERAIDAIAAADVVLRGDPYDERALLALVRAHARAGRHGQARQAHTRYARRMADLDLVPRSFAEVAPIGSSGT